ncbi:MAG: hypothetical protein KDC39_12290 [Actinobacteria bacterium]|nr:hypothetical protein [Actinomycetota bacterium]
MTTQPSEPFSIPDELPRPGSVVVVAILVWIIALLNLAAAVAALVLAIQPGESELLYGAPVSDWVWYFNALLSFVLFLIYIWLGVGQLKGSAQAWMLVNVLMVINIFFALFQLFYGTGFAAILFCLIVLLLNNMRRSKPYFMSHLPPEIKAQIMAAQEQAAAANAAAAAVAARQAAEAQAAQAAAAQAQAPAPSGEATPPPAQQPPTSSPPA